MSIKIIGAGFPRTGTLTLKNALETLGFEKTYHYKDLIANPKKLKYWQELENYGNTDFDKLFDGFEASVDFPGYPYYKVLLNKYPDAKVILTKRNFENWYESTQKTIWQSAHKPIVEKIKILLKRIYNKRYRNIYRCVLFMRKIYLSNQFGNSFTSKTSAEKVFYKHIDDVIKYVPKEKLLVYEVADGWGPLCKFLGLEIPNEDFPHLNKKEDFHKMVSSMLNTAAEN